VHREHHHWYSDRLGRHMGIAVYGHWGPPLLAFPTTGGDEWEYERQGIIGAVSGAIDGGRVKVFCVNTNHSDSFGNAGAHPAHRSHMQARYDDYVRHEVVPFVRWHCRDAGLALWTMGASLGAYHAVNTLLKYPDVVKRCYGLSGVYDMKPFMNGWYDDNLYFNNPVEYLPNEHDGRRLEALQRMDIVLATGRDDPNRGSSENLSTILWNKGIGNALRLWDGWAHDWPWWRDMIRLYIGGHD
jgi:esterase/lipase superfamily enzyme